MQSNKRDAQIFFFFFFKVKEEGHGVNLGWDGFNFSVGGEVKC